MGFELEHPDLVHKNYADSASRLDKLFDREWRGKVLQYQTKALSSSTEGAWTIRYFGNTNFGRKYLNQLPREVIERGSGFGVSRYRVREEYLPK